MHETLVGFSLAYEFVLGSSLHAIRALKHPRWEDFTYENSGESDSSLWFLGDGMTVNEKVEQGDRTWYLRDDYLDVPPGEQCTINATDYR